MNRTVALGLLAFTIVAGAACAMMGAVVLSHDPVTVRKVAMAIGEKVKASPSPRDVPEGSTASAIAAHPFWRVKMTAGKVDDLAAFVCKQRGKAIVTIDDQGRTVITTDFTDKNMFREFMRVGARRQWDWTGLSDRWVYFDMHDYPTRPSRESVLTSLKMKIDIEDYHGKP